MQEFINRQFFHLTIFMLVFGVIFYDTITSVGFTYVDEICAALVMLLYAYKVFKSKNWEFNRMFLTVIGIFLFYLVYSLAIHSNVKKAIALDFILQIKPYVVLFCVFAMRPQFSGIQKKIIKQVVLLCSVYVFAVGVAGLAVYGVISATFVHPSRLATASSVLALLYLYCSDYTKTDRIIFIAILAAGILSGKSKHFGFFAVCAFMVLFLTGSFKMKMNMKNAILLVAGLALMLFAARNKIYFYFIQGGFGEGREASDLYARMAMYFFSTKILTDYIPFGSGFGSFATFASGEYYSPVYIRYGMENMHGLSKESPAFISDTYYPALAQFGIIGVILFFSFWTAITRKAVKSYNKGCVKEAIIVLMTVIFFMIESTSDSTITHNRGMFLMMILGLLLYNINEFLLAKHTLPEEDCP